MAHAYAMEAEASERYTEFADAMEAHNNPAVAELFRKLARIEHAHAEEILATMGWTVPPQPAGGKYRWEGLESPESGDSGELHYLMQPYHALQIARANEERARQFFVKLARQAASTALRKAALAFAQEEAEHVRLADEWLARTPEPARGWAEDPDPPLNVD
jgi:rubrerythrin